MGFKARRGERYRLVGKSTADNLRWFYLASYSTAEAARRAVKHWFASMTPGLLWEIQLRGPGTAVYDGPNHWTRTKGTSFAAKTA